MFMDESVEKCCSFLGCGKTGVRKNIICKIIKKENPCQNSLGISPAKLFHSIWNPISFVLAARAILNSFLSFHFIPLHQNSCRKTKSHEARSKLWPTLFTKRECSLIFSSLKKSSFLKMMKLLNFPIQLIFPPSYWNQINTIQWYLNILNLFGISMILNKWIIQWFSFHVTT